MTMHGIYIYYNNYLMSWGFSFNGWWRLLLLLLPPPQHNQLDETFLVNRISPLGQVLDLYHNENNSNSNKSSDNGVKWSTVEMILRMMAAIGIAYEELPKAATASAAATTNEKVHVSQSSSVSFNEKLEPIQESAIIMKGPSLPSSIKAWPVFVSEHEQLMTIDDIVLVGEDFARAPEDLVALLRPYYIQPETTDPSASGGIFHKKANKKRSKSKALLLQKCYANFIHSWKPR
jgi:hypothetical protein